MHKDVCIALGLLLFIPLGGCESFRNQFGYKDFSFPVIRDPAVGMKEFKRNRISRRSFSCSSRAWDEKDREEECNKERDKFSNISSRCFVDAGGMVKNQFFMLAKYDFKYVDEIKFDLCLEQKWYGGDMIQQYVSSGNKLSSDYIVVYKHFPTEVKE